MDGVIVDSEIHWKTAEGYFLQSVIPTWKSSDQDKIIGIGVHDLYMLLTNEYGLRKTEEQFLELYQEMADEIYGQKVSLLEGFSDLLATLNTHHIPVALASSSPMSWRYHARQVWSSCSLQGCCQRGRVKRRRQTLASDLSPHGRTTWSKPGGLYCDRRFEKWRSFR